MSDADTGHVRDGVRARRAPAARIPMRRGSSWQAAWYRPSGGVGGVRSDAGPTCSWPSSPSGSPSDAHRSSCWSGSRSPTTSFAKAYRHTPTGRRRRDRHPVHLQPCRDHRERPLLPRRVPGAEAACLTETRGVDPEELAEPLYSHWEQDAADHLFAVAAGLDSMVLGETQIHAQVREALRRPRPKERRAPRCARSSTRPHGRAGGPAPKPRSAPHPTRSWRSGPIWRRKRSAISAGRHVVVVGAGRMAGLAVPHLHGRGVGSVRVLNRSLEHARALGRADRRRLRGSRTSPRPIAGRTWWSRRPAPRRR